MNDDGANEIEAMHKKKVNICDVHFELLDYAGALRRYEDWIHEATPHQVCIVNVHTLIMGQRDPAFRKILDSAAMATMDGQPLRWYANAVYDARLKDRVCGPVLMLRCLEYGLDKGWRHYFLGGRESVLEDLCANMKVKFPGVKIVGHYSPPFRQLTEDEEESVAQRINDARPDFLWVGLGAPKQERWIARNLGRVKTPVQVGVGAAFDFHAGAIRRAPEYFQRFGFEWLYRLYQDPRLWWRYLSTNPVFLWRLAVDWARKIITGRHPS